MRVKVEGGEWVDSKDTAIVIELEPMDKVHIVGMPPRLWRYATFPAEDPRTKEQRDQFRNQE